MQYPTNHKEVRTESKGDKYRVGHSIVIISLPIYLFEKRCVV